MTRRARGARLPPHGAGGAAMRPKTMRLAAPGLVLGAAALLSGCADCGASGGWERVYNPLCVATDPPYRPPPPTPVKPPA